LRQVQGEVSKSRLSRTYRIILAKNNDVSKK
jgi:hypothetical protein